MIVEGSRRRSGKNGGRGAVAACVASIENVALLACEWHRHIGSSGAVNGLVNQVVSSLQGKTEENGSLFCSQMSFVGSKYLYVDQGFITKLAPQILKLMIVLPFHIT